MPKVLIVEAVSEGAGTSVPEQITGSKKDVMVSDAERVLARTDWVGAMLRVSVTISRELS